MTQREWYISPAYCEIPFSDDDLYLDYSMHRHAFHDITLTYDREEKKWWAVLRVSNRADGPYGDFGGERCLPNAIVDGLRKVLEEAG